MNTSTAATTTAYCNTCHRDRTQRVAGGRMKCTFCHTSREASCS